MTNYLHILVYFLCMRETYDCPSIQGVFKRHWIGSNPPVKLGFFSVAYTLGTQLLNTYLDV